MHFPSGNDDYAMLALFLSPWKTRETIRRLSRTIQEEALDWGRFLFMANLHFCGPLWFTVLRRDNLLSLLPEGLQQYLFHLHQANVERQDAFRQALKEIVTDLQEIQAPAILLKGAANLCDDPYQDLGARMMGDLDILMKRQHTGPFADILLRRGYAQEPNCFENSGPFNSNAAHHLPRFVKPGTPVALEIHFQTAQGQAGRALTPALSWANRCSVTWEGFKPEILNPTYRLLHTTLHALVPKEAYTTSIMPLNQLAEFAFLAYRYQTAIDWCEWLDPAAGQGLSRQFRSCLTLAHRLMGMPFPGTVRQTVFPDLQVARISAASNNRARYLARCETPPVEAVSRIKQIALRMLVNLYERLTRPVWVWENICYKKGTAFYPARLRCLLTFELRHMKNRFEMAEMYQKIQKVIFLTKYPARSK